MRLRYGGDKSETVFGVFVFRIRGCLVALRCDSAPEVCLVCRESNGSNGGHGDCVIGAMVTAMIISIKKHALST